MPEISHRLEAKIDHLEKSLVHTTPKVSRAASTVGRTLGNFLGQGDLGALAGESLAKLFGHGDYKVKGNTLMGQLTGPTLPTFASDRRGTRIIEREYLGDIVSGTLVNNSSVFTNSSYPLNPTNSKTFPWLSQIATLFDQWEPNGIVLEYVATSSEYNGTSQALWTVIMATDYDGFDPLYPTKIIMENSDYACSTKPSTNLVHGVECDRRERPTPILYTSTIYAGLPVTSSTLGNFQLATSGCSTANVTLGELWISYDITFYKKQIFSNPPIASLPFLSATGTHASGVGFWASAVVSASLQITITQNVGVGSVLNFNNQSSGQIFEITYFQTAQGAAEVYFLTLTGCTQLSARFSTSSTGAFMVYKYVVSTTSSLAFVTTALTTTSTSWALSCAQVPTNYIC